MNRLSHDNFVYQHEPVVQGLRPLLFLWQMPWLQTEDQKILNDAENKLEAALANARWRTAATTGVAAVATGVACVFIPPVGMALGALATGTVSVGTVFVSWPIWKNVENIDAIQNDIKKAKRELNEAEQRRHENIPHETHAENIT